MMNSLNDSDLIDFILGIIVEASNKKISDSLKAAWKIGLDGVPKNLLIKGFIVLMQDKEDNYLPHPGELRKICRGIQSAKRKENTVRNDQKQIDYKNIPKTAEQVKKIAVNLTHVKKPEKTKIKFPSIDLFETLDYKTAELKELTTQGHIDFDFFENQCYLRHRVKPGRTRHAYRRWHTFKEKDDKGNFKRLSHGYVGCKEDGHGAEPITIGYFL